jgi:hypothetical protein
MSNTYLPKQTFAGGELSPEMWGRSDLQKFSTAAKEMTNFYTHTSGAVSNRPGLKYINNAKCNDKKTRLIPFVFSTTQTYILEFGDKYIRFYTNNGQIVYNNLPYEIATPYSANDLAKLKYTQSADTIFIAHPDYPPYKLTRTDHTAWTLSEFNFKNGPFMDSNITATTITPSATTGTITLTASSAIFDSKHVGSIWQISQKINAPGVAGSFTAAGTSSVILNNKQWELITHGTWSGKIRIKVSYDNGATWRIVKNYSSVSDNNIKSSETLDEELIVNGAIPQIVLECYSYSSGTLSYDLTGYAYTVDGIVKITSVTDSTHATATVIKQLGNTSATDDWAEGAWSTSKGFPATVAFHENRLLFANTNAQPQTVWFSKIGSYNDFGVSQTALDTDAVTASLISNSVNAIHSLVPLNDVIGMTEAAEWKITPGSNTSTITPTSIAFKRQSTRGSNLLNPLVIGNRIIYTQKQGSIVRDIGYNWQSDSYTGDDLTILARHMFEDYTIVDWTYQESPNSIVWAIRSDGILLGLTYMKEQDVWGWHRHITQGKFESVACISGDGYDEIWFVINRTDKDGNAIKFIEKMSTRMGSTDDIALEYMGDTAISPANQFFVDAGLSYDGEPTASVSGLEHLEGKTVAILADGNVMPSYFSGCQISAAVPRQYHRGSTEL